MYKRIIPKYYAPGRCFTLTPREIVRNFVDGIVDEVGVISKIFLYFFLCKTEALYLPDIS